MANKKQVELMQEFLVTFRKASNLTIDDISKKIGLSKQGYINLEKKTANLSICQYTTLRLLFEYIGERDNNETLRVLLELILDSDDTDDVKQLRNNIMHVTNTKQSKKDMITNLNYTLISSPAMKMIPMMGAVLAASLTGIKELVKEKQKGNIKVINKQWIKDLFD